MERQSGSGGGGRGGLPAGEVLYSGGCFPGGFWREAKALYSLAWPTSLSILFHYLIQPISLAFCGHLGRTELAAVAMALSVIYITTVSVGRGLAFGGDTFFSQTYGSQNKKQVGVYLQRALWFGILSAMVVSAVLLNTETLLLLLKQDPTVARMAQEYTQLFIPGAFAYCWLFTLMRYLLCQNRVIPNLVICIVSCAVCAVLNYGLIHQADMGIRGSAIALMMTYYLVLILLFSYIWGSGIYRETWPGWTFEGLEEWGEFSRVAVSSIFMTVLFWVCTEVGTFLSGILGDSSISAFSICFQVEGFAWMIPLGLGGACTSRVGQFLGANEPLGALTTCRVSLVFAVFLSVALAVINYVLRNFIPMAFTSRPELVEYTANILQIVSIFLLLEGFGGLGVSIIRGVGRQTLGTIIIFISYYLVALPIGVPLMFKTFLGLAGLWWGYVIGLFVQDVCLFAFVSKIDWDNEASTAQQRAGVHAEFTASVNAPPSDVNERTRLVDSEPYGDSGIASTSHDSGLLANDTRPSRANIILRRLATLVAFGAILVAGVLTRLYVKIQVPNQNFTELCIPTHNNFSAPIQHEILQGARPWNKTLPFCNETVSQTIPDPLYAIWV